MSIVETALFEEGEVLVQSRVRKVLELIGVRNLYPVDIIKHHILPQFTSGSWKVCASVRFKIKEVEPTIVLCTILS